MTTGVVRRPGRRRAVLRRTLSATALLLLAFTMPLIATGLAVLAFGEDRVYRFASSYSDELRPVAVGLMVAVGTAVVVALGARLRRSRGPERRRAVAVGLLTLAATAWFLWFLVWFWLPSQLARG